MKILQFGKFYPPVFGGIENVMYEITTGLNNQGIKCDVLCSNNKNEYSEETIDNYTIYRTKSYGKYFSTSITPQLVFKLKDIQDNYDVISVHFPDPMAALALFLAKPKSKIVIHWHSDIIKQKYLLKLYEPLQDWVIRRADAIIGATETHINGSDKFKFFRDKSKIIPYPFDVVSFKNSLDLNLLNELEEKYNSKKNIFAMGRLIYYKGFQYLIDAAKDLPDNYQILIGGDGELKNELQDKINQNDLNDKVVLLGSISHNRLGTYYSFCDIFCLPSIQRGEMFGIVQLEAMSFGKPVVSTKLERSGVCNVNVDGETGICVAPSNSKELASGIKEILTDLGKYEKFSKNAFKRVETIYKKEKVVEQLIDMYLDLLRNARLKKQL